MTQPYRDVVPVGATSLRPGWDDLPDAVRAAVAEHEAGDVADVRPTRSGYTPGFAAGVRLTDGRRVFVKAADDARRRMFADAYRREAEVVRDLPPALPAPRVRWSADVDGWFVVAFDHVDARPPHRPWTRADLDGVLTMLAALPDRWGPPGPDVPAFADVFGSLPGLWDEVADPAVQARRDDAAALAAGALRADPATLVRCHTDVRDDNLLVDADGRWWLCDWNGLSSGPRLFDALVVLISARGDDHDADALLAAHRVPADPSDDEVDGLLALLAGYFYQRAALPEEPWSPYLRTHQRWYAEQTWAWLCARRGWTRPPSGDDLGPDDGPR